MVNDKASDKLLLVAETGSVNEFVGYQRFRSRFLFFPILDLVDG